MAVEALSACILRIDDDADRTNFFRQAIAPAEQIQKQQHAQTLSLLAFVYRKTGQPGDAREVFFLGVHWQDKV